MPPVPRPLAMVAELTYRCPLKCPYCSNPLELGNYRRELDTQTWNRVLDEAAGLGVAHVHFSGGEPLARTDLCELIQTARSCDLYTNLSTSAMTADANRLSALRDAGLDALQISLQDVDQPENDRLAGVPSYERKATAVRVAKELGFAVTLNVVLHRQNLDRIERIIQTAVDWQAERLELAHTQYVGWAFKNRDALLPSREQLERAEEAVRIARERWPDGMEILHVLPDYFQQYPKACVNGWGRVFLTVAPDGAVLPCQSAREITGLEFPNVADASLEEIWFNAPVFQRFRGTDWMPEPCRSCDRREVDFGGCRCQAFLLTGDVTATDPVCHLAPSHHLIEAAIAESETNADALAYRVMPG